jgi:hypothetical protein
MGRPPGPLTLSEDDRRVLAVWAAGCAQRVLPLFQVRARTDRRPRNAIDGALAFARGELRIGPARALAAEAHAAARAAADPAAVAAARAAGQAAATAHMASHARGAAAYAAEAIALATGSESSARHEVEWQWTHMSPAVGDVLRRLPPPSGAGLLGAIMSELQAKVAPAPHAG